MESQMSDIDKMFSNMGGLSAAFGTDKISYQTVIGFYGVECGSMLSIGGSFLRRFLVLRHWQKKKQITAEFLLTHPISRLKIVGEKLLAVVVILVGFNVICMTCSIASFAAIGETVPYASGYFILYNLSCKQRLPLFVLAFLAFLKRSNIGIGLGLSFIIFFGYFHQNQQKCRISQIHYTVSIFRRCPRFLPCSLDGTLIAIGIGIALVCAGIGSYKYQFKDIAA